MGSVNTTHFALVTNVVKDLQGIANNGYVKAAGAHAVAPVATVAAAAIQFAVHATSAVIKTAVFIAKLPALWLKDLAPWANPADAVEHLKRAAVTVPLAVAVPVVSLVSFPGALAIIDAVGAGSVEPVKGWWEQFKAKDWKGKIFHVGQATVDGTKQAFDYSVEKTKDAYKATTLKHVGIFAGAVAVGAEAYRNGSAAWNQTGDYGSSTLDAAKWSYDTVAGGTAYAVNGVSGLFSSDTTPAPTPAPRPVVGDVSPAPAAAAPQGIFDSVKTYVFGK